jgi:hypothetical protein
MKPRFKTKVDRRHRLYRLHETFVTSGGNPNAAALKNLEEMETRCIDELAEALKGYPDNAADFVTLFNDCVEAEVKYYE